MFGREDGQSDAWTAAAARLGHGAATQVVRSLQPDVVLDKVVLVGFNGFY